MVPNDHIFHSIEFLLVNIYVFWKTGFQRFVKLEILSKEFFFHMSYGIFTLKKLSMLDTCYFKAAGAIDPETKVVF